MNSNKYLKTFKALLQSAVSKIDETDEIEDAKYLFSLSLKRAAKTAIVAEATLHAENPEFNGEGFDSYNEANDTLTCWAEFFPEQAGYFRGIYQSSFEDLAPTINECIKCPCIFIESNCPNCEDKKFIEFHT